MMHPSDMVAMEIAEPGPPDVLRVSRRPVPGPGPGEVLIQVAAAGVNRPDLLQRLGRYPAPPGASDIPGLEVAGTVAEAGDGTPWRAGDAVCALVTGGGYAEYCVAPGPQCLPVPDGLSLVEAAAMPETFFTVWANLFDPGRPHLDPGETCLVHGGSSGIGTTAVQLVRAFGGRAFVTAGSAAKCAACERLGAERAINYRTEDFVTVVRDLTGGRGVDVILDMVAGSYTMRNFEALAVGGRLVQIAMLEGPRVEVHIPTLMQRRLIWTGSTLRPRSVAEKGAIASALRERVWPLVARGEVKPVIHATFPLSRAADAHRLMESGRHIGKIVLVAG